ncbi:hypothetical protein RHMOL_Rhmol04G0023400 [Rhododendron molle]|uniref:Uncharacterized protein n=1 Tax=Rhododendron molle TaxID=49168 RepID=A0ACC0NW67_RHOML|nr:hypothetical protein RHMOL_Rhmol04G0023400 [Rhododendron molle]
MRSSSAASKNQRMSPQVLRETLRDVEAMVAKREKELGITLTTSNLEAMVENLEAWVENLAARAEKIEKMFQPAKAA